VCDLISFLVNNHEDTDSILLSDDNYLEICEKASSSDGTNCSNFQVSKMKSTKKRCLPFVCKLCHKECNAQTRRRRDKAISTTLGENVKRQDPSSYAPFDQLSPESKNARFRRLSTINKTANQKLKRVIQRLLDSDSQVDIQMDDSNVIGLLRKCFSYLTVQKSVAKAEIIKALLETEINSEKADESQIIEFADAIMQ
jgi:hypothetical protein